MLRRDVPHCHVNHKYVPQPTPQNNKHKHRTSKRTTKTSNHNTSNPHQKPYQQGKNHGQHGKEAQEGILQVVEEKHLRNRIHIRT